MNDPRRVAFAGDWHSNTAYAKRAIAHAKERGADVIVHVGDYGYRFPRAFVDGVDEALRRADLDLWFVEGNHDEPARYRGPDATVGLHQIGARQWHIPRGHRWTWSGMEFLGCGGAHSVDRPFRTPGLSWWPEEAITLEDVRRCINGGRADVLVAHDCPLGVVIPGIDDRTEPPPFPPLEIQHANEHRRLVRLITDVVQPGLIVHGHYHVAYETGEHDWPYPARIVGLDCDGTDLERNVRVFDLEGGWGTPQ